MGHDLPENVAGESLVKRNSMLSKILNSLLKLSYVLVYLMFRHSYKRSQSLITRKLDFPWKVFEIEGRVIA